VTVRVDDVDVARVEAIMAQHSPGDWQQRRASYGPDWTGFDETSASSSSYGGGTDPIRRV
jgi:hypothetical protein